MCIDFAAFVPPPLSAFWPLYFIFGRFCAGQLLLLRDHHVTTLLSSADFYFPVLKTFPHNLLQSQMRKTFFWFVFLVGRLRMKIVS